MAIKLGMVVTDSITGFTGVAVSRTEYIHGCARIAVQPRELHEGKPIEAQVFDELQLAEYSSATNFHVYPETGGPGDVPAPRRVPPR